MRKSYQVLDWGVLVRHLGLSFLSCLKREEIRVFAFALLGLVGLPPSLFAQEVVFPADAPVWNVKNYGAVGDGVADDTQAFKNAIAAAVDNGERYGAIRIIYVPNGTYRLTDRLDARVGTSGFSLGWRAGFFLQGQSRDGTVLKLANATPGFTDVAVPKAVIRTGSENPHDTNGGGNQAFRHYIKNLTVDVGSGNPGAIGIDYICNNRGGIYDVLIRSSDPGRVGVAGLAMNRSWPGPAIVKNVTIQGFQTGVQMLNHYQYSMTLENITLQNQLDEGIVVVNNTLTIRNLQSINTVPVVRASSGNGHLTIIGGNFQGGASGNAAIRNWAKTHLRGITSQGYGTLVQDNTGQNRPVAGGASVTLDEYNSHGPYKKFSSSVDGFISLPVQETPQYVNNTFSQWANVITYGATASNASNDDLPALQAAIDSGKPIVYLPQGSYHISNTLVIRGSVRKFIGLCAALSKTSSFPANTPLIRFDGSTGDSVILQQIRFSGDILHNSSKSLAFVNCDLGGRLSSTAGTTGGIFLEDVIGPAPLVVNANQSVWGRQVNIEFYTGNFIQNQGGKVWLLGYKTEGKNGSVLENNGGWAEVLGGFFYPNDGLPSVPMVINNEGKVSLNYKINSSNIYPVHVRDIQNSITRDFLSSEAPGSNNVTLYSGSNEVHPPASITLLPVADAFVRDGTASTNYGADPILFVKNDSGGYRRESFIKFNLQELNASSSTVKLYVDVTGIGATTVGQGLIQAGNAWTESGITWNNRPASIGSALATWQSMSNSTIELDVTTAVQAALAGGQQEITFRLYGTVTGSQQWVNYASKENMDTTLRPRLVVSGSTPPSSEPQVVARYNFENASALGADTSSGASNNGTVVGNVTASTTEMAVGASSARFIGAGNNHIAVSDADPLDGTDKLTISFWVRPTATGVNGVARGLASKRVAADNQVAYSLFIYTGGRLFVDMDQGTTSPKRVDTGYVVQQNWQMITVVFDGTLPSAERLKLYINGALYSTISHPVSQIRNMSSPLFLGTLNNNYQSGGSLASFDGWLDDVRIYRDALSSSDLSTLYQVE